MTKPDWGTIASLATAGGTLVLAVSTFASVRSANRAARAAEQSLLVGLRPLLMPSRLQDPEQKILFADRKWLRAPGGGGDAQADGDVIYLALSLRNAGSGVAVVHGWRFAADRVLTNEDLQWASFRRQSRDIYIPPGDIGFWQGAFRDPADPQYEDAVAAVKNRQDLTIELCYGDHQGGQRMESRFTLLPRDNGQWIASAARHHNVDRPDPR